MTAIVVPQNVNVDLCERSFVSMLVQPTLSKAHADTIVNIPDTGKTKVLRGLNQQQVIAMGDDLLTLVKTTLGVTTLDLTTNTNNQIGKDLHEKATNSHIELKLGQATDGALGLLHLDMLVGAGTADFIDDKAKKQQRQNDYAAGRKDIALQAHKDLLRAACDHINTTLPVGPVTSPRASHALNMLYAGINNLEQIKALETNAGGIPKIYRFSITPKTGWKLDSRPLLTDGNVWRFNGAAISRQGRLALTYENDGYIIKLLLNQKNRWSSKALGITDRTNWTYGLGSQSMNLWIRKKPAPKPVKAKP